MKRLDLDFAQRRRTGNWTAIVLLAGAVVLTAKILDAHFTLQDENDSMASRIARLEAGSPDQAARGPVSEATLSEIRLANEVIGQITLPWDRLFRAVEAAAGERVALLGITPDQRSGTVEVSGECVDLQALFDYVKRLERQPSLSRVYLLNHKVNGQDPQRPVRFTVTASWNSPSSRI